MKINEAEVIITQLIKDKVEEIKEILVSKRNIVEKVVMLRRIAREMADNFDFPSYENLEDFYNDYDKNNSPLIKLEGPGIRHNNIIFLKR